MNNVINRTSGKGSTATELLHVRCNSELATTEHNDPFDLFIFQVSNHTQLTAIAPAALNCTSEGSFFELK